MNNTYKLDTMIKVDETLCIHCGSCVRACPGGLIAAKEFPVPIETLRVGPVRNKQCGAPC